MAVTDIIVLGYNLPEMELACIDSIIKNTKSGSYVITYFDNYNSGKTLTQAWNFLIKNSICDYICLLNSDTQVTPRWLDLLIDGLESNKKICCIGPSTNNCHSIQKTISLEEAQSHLNEVDILKDPISGFCFLFRKKLWKEVGGFDERFDFYGSESDFVARAQKLGYVCAWAKSAFVHHIGEVSIKSSGKNVEEERRRAVKLYWENRKPTRVEDTL